jgi:hypothetical protein
VTMSVNEWSDFAWLQLLCNTMGEPRFESILVSGKPELAAVGESDPLVVDGVIPPSLSCAWMFGSSPERSPPMVPLLLETSSMA